jgi:hypothetical protein
MQKQKAKNKKQMQKQMQKPERVGFKSGPYHPIFLPAHATATEEQ